MAGVECPHANGMTIGEREAPLLQSETADAELDLDRVYRAHAASVSRWVHRLWGSRDAEDVVQEIFLVAQRRFREFRADAAVGTWLYSVTVKVVISRRRKERLRRLLWARAEPEIAEGHAPTPTPLVAAERAEASALVYSVLDHLSERDRTLLILFEMEGLPAETIASILNLSVNAVWVALSRARARFKAQFFRRHPERLEGASDARLR